MIDLSRHELIPEEKRPDVARAVREALGVDTVDEIQPLTGGLSSARVFRIAVREVPYMLRVHMSTDPRNDPARQFACMQRAADAGVAPRIWYANAGDRILISDYVDAHPLPATAGPMLASTIRTVHSLPGFPRTYDYLDFVDRCAGRLQAARLVPGDDTEDVFLRYADVMKAYPRDGDLVASHNDVKPENTLFDGGRIWIVDWEAANLNDRYVDLSIVANFFARDRAEEERLLTTYFDGPPTDYQRARFHLMRQIMHMAYAAFLIVLGTSSGGRFQPDARPPDFSDFHDRLRARHIDMTTADARVQYGWTHWEKLSENLRSPRMADALARIGGLAS